MHTTRRKLPKCLTLSYISPFVGSVVMPHHKTRTYDHTSMSVCFPCLFRPLLSVPQPFSLSCPPYSKLQRICTCMCRCMCMYFSFQDTSIMITTDETIACSSIIWQRTKTLLQSQYMYPGLSVTLHGLTSWYWVNETYSFRSRSYHLSWTRVFTRELLFSSTRNWPRFAVRFVQTVLSWTGTLKLIVV